MLKNSPKIKESLKKKPLRNNGINLRQTTLTDFGVSLNKNKRNKEIVSEMDLDLEDDDSLIISRKSVRRKRFEKKPELMDEFYDLTKRSELRMQHNKQRNEIVEEIESKLSKGVENSPQGDLLIMNSPLKRFFMHREVSDNSNAEEDISHRLKILKAISFGAYRENPDMTPFQPFSPHDKIFDEIEKIDDIVNLTDKQIRRFISASAIKNYVRSTIDGRSTSFRVDEFIAGHNEMEDVMDVLMRQSLADLLKTDKNSVVAMEIMRIHEDYAISVGCHLANYCSRIFVSEIPLLMLMIQTKRNRDVTENMFWEKLI